MLYSHYFIGKYMHVFISSGFYCLLLLVRKISEKTKALCHTKIFLFIIFDMWPLNVTIISVNPLYLIVNKIHWYFEEINGNIYLIITPTVETKEIITNMKYCGVKSKNVLDLKLITEMIMMKNIWQSNLIRMMIYLKIKR